MSDDDLKKQLEFEKKYFAKNQRLSGLDRFGGVISSKNFGEGRFRTKKINGKWFFVTPNGNLFWSFGINAVGQSSGTRITGREHYFKSDATSDNRFLEHYSYDKLNSTFYNFEAKNKSIKYDSQQQYFEVIKNRFNAWGMNTIGNWSNPNVILNCKIVFTSTINHAKTSFMKSELKYPVLDYFDEAFEKKSTQRSFSKERRTSFALLSRGIYWL